MVCRKVGDRSGRRPHELVRWILSERDRRILVPAPEIAADGLANHGCDGCLAPLRLVTELAKGLLLEAEIRGDVAAHGEIDSIAILRYRQRHFSRRRFETSSADERLEIEEDRAMRRILPYATAALAFVALESGVEAQQQQAQASAPIKAGTVIITDQEQQKAQ